MDSITIDTTNVNAITVICYIGDLSTKLMYTGETCTIVSVGGKLMMPGDFENKYNCTTKLHLVTGLYNMQLTEKAQATLPIHEIPVAFDDEGCVWSQSQGFSLNGDIVSATKSYLGTCKIPNKVDVLESALKTIGSAIGWFVN